MQLVKATRDALLKPLQVVSGIVERRQTLPILANILVRKDGERVSFTATDLELQIQTCADSAPARTPPRRRSPRASWSTSCARCRSPMCSFAGQQEALGRQRQEPLQPADAGGRGVSDRRAGRVHGRLFAAGGDAEVPAVDGPLRDGAAGHPLLPERHAAGGRRHHRARRRHRRPPPGAVRSAEGRRDERRSRRSSRARPSSNFRACCPTTRTRCACRWRPRRSSSASATSS